MSELVAVVGDAESHGNGELICDNNHDKMFSQGKKVALIDSNAQPDDFPHTGTETSAATGTDKLWVSGKKVHRNNDTRYCGASTIVTNQNKLYAN